MSKFTKHLSTITEQFKLNELFLMFYSTPLLSSFFFIMPQIIYKATRSTQTLLMRQMKGKKEPSLKKMQRKTRANRISVIIWIYILYILAE